MSRTKFAIGLIGLWLAIQAIAWFYAGKDVAGLTALISGIFLGCFSPIIYLFIEDTD